MNSFIEGYALGLTLLRWLLFATAIVVALACLLDWLTRTRRVNPFSAPARFSRNHVDPMLRPIERRILRAGGNPANAPWWMLAIVLVGGILLLTSLEFLGQQVLAASLATQRGPAGLYVLVVRWAVGFLQIALIVRVISSWVGGSPYSPWLRWSYVLTDPILSPLRRIIPTLGPIDITPIVAYFALSIAGSLLVSFV